MLLYPEVGSQLRFHRQCRKQGCEASVPQKKWDARAPGRLDQRLLLLDAVVFLCLFTKQYNTMQFTKHHINCITYLINIFKN